MRVYDFYDYLGFAIEIFVVSGQLSILILGLSYFVNSILETKTEK